MGVRMAIPQDCVRMRQPRLRVALLSGAALLLLAGPAAAQLKSISTTTLQTSFQQTIVSPLKVTTSTTLTTLVTQPALVPAPVLTTIVPIFHDPQPVPGLAVVAPTLVSIALPSTAAVVPVALPVQTISPVLTSVSPIIQPTPATSVVNISATSTLIQTPTVTFQPTSTITTTVLVNTPVVTAPPPGVTATLAGLRVASLDQSVIGPSPTIGASALGGNVLAGGLVLGGSMQTCSATGCQTTVVPSRLDLGALGGGGVFAPPGFGAPGVVYSQAPVVPPGGGPPSGVPGASAQGNAGGQGGQGGPGGQGNAPVQLADLGAGGGGITGRGAGGGQGASAAALDGMAESTGQGGGPGGASGGARAVLVNFASQRADEGLAGEVAIANALANIAPAAGGAAPAARQRRFAVDLNGDGLIQFHVSEHTLTAMQRSATPGARVLDDVVNVGPQANAAVKVENGEIVIQ